eukprot:1605684-Rhodomonas_salina.1
MSDADLARRAMCEIFVGSGLAMPEASWLGRPTCLCDADKLGPCASEAAGCGVKGRDGGA